MNGSPTQPPAGEYLLAIESSCDETAAAVIDRKLNVHSNVVASQSELHVRYGGVVPEIASRAHVARIIPVLDDALKQADKSLEDISAIAVATHPGLVGSLLVGLTAAKTLATVLRIPLIAVNHVEAHLFACRLAAGREVFPAIGLVISGGHTNLYDCHNSTRYELLGSTIDDAAGEAFDKVAKLLGLAYPGGPSIEKAAANGDPRAFAFPRPMLNRDSLDFSFSGLKTAVLYEANGKPGSSKPAPTMSEQRIADIAASFQEAVADVLVSKCRQAIEERGRVRICMGGGVAANSRIRQRLAELCEQSDCERFVAPMEYCTDNAAMAAIAWESYHKGQFAELDIDVVPGLIRKNSMPANRESKSTR